MNMQADQGSKTETWTFLVGPTLQGTQFSASDGYCLHSQVGGAFGGACRGPIHLWTESGIRGS
jgi:hypothetical protein